jgi:HlyD family type I secretion membrane fusion protein
VQNIRFHTTGGVIRPGDVIMEVVPATDSMVINAHVSVMDIDNVHPGLKAEVKFTAFPGRFMPIIIGEVQNVSKGSINPNDGRTAPYYLAQINVSKGMVPDDIENRISPGMPADVIISTGERTVADYLTSPLTDAVRKSMREE